MKATPTIPADHTGRIFQHRVIYSLRATWAFRTSSYGVLQLDVWKCGDRQSNCLEADIAVIFAFSPWSVPLNGIKHERADPYFFVLKRCRQPWFGSTFLSVTIVRTNSRKRLVSPFLVPRMLLSSPTRKNR